MKLSELKGERAVEVIADLIAPIVNLSQDWSNMKVSADYRKENESDDEVAIRAFKDKIPGILKSHKEDILTILCTLNEKNKDELSVVDIINGAMDLTNDKDFMSLFLSVARPVGKKRRTKSSAIVETSKPE